MTTYPDFDQILRFTAAEILRRVLHHEEAPEGIELFDFFWYPFDSPPTVVFGVYEPIRYWGAEDLTEEELYKPMETDEVRANLRGEITVLAPTGAEKKLPWRLGWHRKGRKVVLWFADGLPKRRRK